MTPLEVLARAKEILEVGGWQKDSAGDCSDRSTPHCLFGAMTCAAFEMADNGGAWPSLDVELRTERYVIRALAERYPLHQLDIEANHLLFITQANDQFLTDKEEAVAVMSRAVEFASPTSDGASVPVGERWAGRDGSPHVSPPTTLSGGAA